MACWRNHIHRARHGCKHSYHRGAHVVVQWGETLTDDLQFGTARSACHVRRLAGRNSRLCSRRAFHYACRMKITRDVRKYAEQDIAEEEVLKNGMEDQSRELTENGSELYAKP